MRKIYSIKIPNENMTFNVYGSIEYKIKKDKKKTVITLKTIRNEFEKEFAYVILNSENKPIESHINKVIKDKNIQLSAIYSDTIINLTANNGYKKFYKKVQYDENVIDCFQLLEFIKNALIIKNYHNEINIFFLELGVLIPYSLKIEEIKDTNSFKVILNTKKNVEQKFCFIYENQFNPILIKAIMPGYILELV